MRITDFFHYPGRHLCFFCKRLPSIHGFTNLIHDAGSILDSVLICYSK